MSIYNCHRQQPQPWMSYISPNKIVYPGECCPALVTDLTHLLPFQVISQGAFQKLEYRLYGDTAWTEIAITYSEVVIEGFYFISYNGEAITELPCGVYEFKLTAGEVWWFEPIKIEDFTITENTLTVRDDLMTPFKISEQIIDTTPLIAPCDMILPFMFRTENVTSGTVTVYMVDESGTETEITITVSTAVIDGMTYYWHSEEYLYPFLTCGRYYLKIVDGANTYYSVPFVPECGISDIPDGYKVLRDFNGCVIRNDEGVIEYEEAVEIPPDEPDFIVKYGFLYNWYAANDVRNIAASGWSLPSLADYEALMLALDPSGTKEANIAGGQMKESGLIYWDTPNTDATNGAAFNARGAGVRCAFADGVPSDFAGLKNYAMFWTTSDAGVSGGYDRGGGPYLAYNSAVFISEIMGYPFIVPKLGGSAIRLIKDTTTLTHGQTGTYVGNDGKVYRTICIGTQEWLADNLCETLYRDGSPIPEVTDNSAWAALVTGARCSYNNDESNAFTI